MGSEGVPSRQKKKPPEEGYKAMKKRTIKKWLIGGVVAWLVGLQLTVVFPSADTWNTWKNSRVSIASLGGVQVAFAAPTPTRTFAPRYSYPTPTPPPHISP